MQEKVRGSERKRIQIVLGYVIQGSAVATVFFFLFLFFASNVGYIDKK
jgi:hypothetical protein